ncbi:TOS1 protein [Xylariaceae sp. FL1272]|nr:TOS1 protein [Xylariaceae sp. FL1272]
MKYSAAVLLGSAVASVSAGYCADAVESGGNYYCPGAVKQIKYSGLDIAGSYRAVSVMDNAGTCTFDTKDYSGAMAPFDEGLSMHFRGPIQISNVAVYTPGSSSTKREAPKKSKRHQHHGHQHLHKKHREEEEKRQVGATVTVEMNGQMVTWINSYSGETAAADADAGSAQTTTTAEAEAPAATTVAATSAKATIKTSSDSGSIEGDWVRSAYYCAEDGTADGLTFLANVGSDAVSGTWDTVWGSSLAYVSEDGKTVAGSPQVLKNTLLDDATEIAIFSDSACTAETCGTYRPKSVAYRGFEGASKVFIVEFTMPTSGLRGQNEDMPAFWLLNSAIPRTAQYASCSCWMGDNTSPQEGGCGEFDVIEILTPGETRAKSTFHFANGLGDSHYFERPVSSSGIYAVVFDGENSSVSIKQLDSFDWATSLTSTSLTDLIVDEIEDALVALADIVAS